MICALAHQEPVCFHAGQHRESPVQQADAEDRPHLYVLRREKTADVPRHAQGVADQRQAARDGQRRRSHSPLLPLTGRKFRRAKRRGIVTPWPHDPSGRWRRGEFDRMLSRCDNAAFTRLVDGLI